jgi:prepilin-type processing-associated H-X9-DG protein
VIGLILGIVSLGKIKRSNGRLSGQVLAIAGICVSGFMIFFSIPMMAAMLLPALARAKAKAQTANCINNVKQLNLGVIMYADANGEKFPSATQWCDLVLPQMGSDKPFHCPSAASGSRCDYAFNQNLSGRRMGDIKNPGQTVLVFECEGGWNQSGGRELVTQQPRHAQRLVVGFADGHVESVSRVRLEQLAWEP